MIRACIRMFLGQKLSGCDCSRRVDHGISALPSDSENPKAALRRKMLRHVPMLFFGNAMKSRIVA